MTSSERRAVISLALLYAFRMLGLFMVLPVLAIYADDKLTGSTPVLIGLALGVYGLTQALFQIPLGMLSDRIGRKPVILFGLILFGLGSVIAAEATTIYGVILGRALQGSGAIASTLMALMADVTRDQHRTKAMAVIGISIGLTFSLALVLGPLLAAGYGLEGIFNVTAIMALLGAALLIWMVPSPSRFSRQVDALPAREMIGRCLRNPELLRFDFGIFALHFIMMAAFVSIPLALIEHDFARDMHWKIYLPITLVSFVFMMPMIMAAERRGRGKEVFLIAIGALAVVMALFALLPEGRVMLLMAMLIFFTAFNVLEASLPSLVSKAVYAGGKGTAMGIYSTSQFLGAFCGGTVGGLLLDRAGVDAIFWLSAAAALIWLVLARSMQKPRALQNVLFEFVDSEQANHVVAEQLRDLDGVEEVMVIEEDRIAYLKVSSAFEPGSLEALKAKL